MTNYGVGFTNNTNARKDKGGARHRALLTERRADRDLEDAAQVVNKLQETISEVERAKFDKDGSSNDELKALNRELKEERKKVVRLTEELEDKTAQIEKLKTTAPVQTTSIGSSVELDTARANIKSAKEQILTLETRIASLEDENGIISDAINLVKREKATLEKAIGYDFSKTDLSLSDATLIVDKKYEQTITTMENRLMKLETERDNLAGNLKAAQLRQASGSSSALVGSDKLYEILDSLLDPTRRNQGGDLPTRLSNIVEEVKTLRESAKRNAVKSELGRPSSAGGDSRDRKIVTLNESLLNSKNEILRLNEKVVVKVAKIQKLRGEILNKTSEIESLKSASLATPPATTNGEDSNGAYDELFESLALEKKKSSLLEDRLVSVESERDEARLSSITIKNRNLSDAGGDSCSISASQNVSSTAVSNKTKDAVTKMAGIITALNKTIAELREENTELLLASVGI